MIDYKPITAEQINNSYVHRQAMYGYWENPGDGSKKITNSGFSAWSVFFWILTHIGAFVLGYIQGTQDKPEQVPDIQEEKGKSQ